jgi:hypothetical protein
LRVIVAIWIESSMCPVDGLLVAGGARLVLRLTVDRDVHRCEVVLGRLRHDALVEHQEVLEVRELGLRVGLGSGSSSASPASSESAYQRTHFSRVAGSVATPGATAAVQIASTFVSSAACDRGCAAPFATLTT